VEERIDEAGAALPSSNLQRLVTRPEVAGVNKVLWIWAVDPSEADDGGSVKLD